jgi:hypothetical protein
MRRQKPTGRIAYHPRPYALRKRSGAVAVQYDRPTIYGRNKLTKKNNV